MKAEYQPIYDELSACVRYLAEHGRLTTGATVVLGCSTSEVAGGTIGHNSVPELGAVLASAFLDTCRALGPERGGAVLRASEPRAGHGAVTLDALKLTQVSVRPGAHAGRSAPVRPAYVLFAHPHHGHGHPWRTRRWTWGIVRWGLHDTVPWRCRCAWKTRRSARRTVVMAYSRYPLIGGARAQYAESIR